MKIFWWASSLTTGRFGREPSIFAPDDKVMQIENDYAREAFNGDLGRIRRIDQTESVLIAEFGGRKVEYPFGELDALVPADATTIHKSQGSEYPAVVITLVTQHHTMLARNLVYRVVNEENASSSLWDRVRLWSSQSARIARRDDGPSFKNGSPEQDHERTFMKPARFTFARVS